MEEKEGIWEKMISGEIYDATHPELIKRLEVTRERLWEFNKINPGKKKEMQDLLSSILGGHGKKFHFNQPFRCDYGSNIYIGENFFANFNLTILDEAEVRIGENCFIGPNVSIYTACHPLDSESRNKGLEWSEPVMIGDSVWIGGSTTILPGVSIGDNVVIGAGSVVTKDIPSNVVAVGNPARIIKYLS
ncbi:MAG: sugar O-acetyltransferase [Muribaculaceae bacterium]|nr:sugar O-acetyltransferase [Muribaculaceae bacterium]